MTTPNLIPMLRGTVGTPLSLQVEASDSGGAELMFSATGLPPGLSISSSGLISGTPTTDGLYQPSVQAISATSYGSGMSFPWLIGPAGALTGISVASPGDLIGTVGTPVSFQIQAAAGGFPLTFSATGLPPGLSISSSGLISGTPTTASPPSPPAPGPPTVTVTATGGGGAGTAAFTWQIDPYESFITFTQPSSWP